VHGAVDPSSGTAALLEVARAFGAASLLGLRPRRSVVFANWDAEEDLLGGSTSWGKDFRDRLRKDGVAYLNVDLASAGAEFAGGATPALAEFLMDVTRDVDDPRGGGTVYRAWAAQSKTGGGPEVEAIVGATDYTVFQENIGMACVDMSFVGTYGVYHSQYDNYFTVSRLVDPGLRYSTTMARLWGLAAWRLADADILPMRFSAYARAIPPYCDAIEAKALAARPDAPPPRLQAARDAARRWEEAANAFERRLRARRRRGACGITPEQARRVNERLMAVERAMTEDEGLRSRPFFKHLIYAPQPTYRREELPRLFEAIEAGDWGAWPRYERQLVAAFDAAARLMDRARQEVESNQDPGSHEVADAAAAGRSR
jgi:N-acetylated-alpha-linked acidic dipeptidase